MNIRQPLLPDEIASAKETFVSAWLDASPTRSMRARYFLFYTALFAGGAWLGSALYLLGVLDQPSDNLWRGCLTVVSILSGFMITTMLFTGKAEAAKSISLNQLEQFASKSNHLLVSQFATLMNHIASIGVISLLLSVSPASLFFSTLVVIGTALVFTSLVRSLLIPLQIIELHRFAHAALIAEKKAELKNNLPG